MGLFKKRIEATYDIEGMTCGSCVNHVTKAIQGVDGVKEVQVDLEAGQARVTHKGDPDAHAVVAAVKAAGYEAKTPGAT